MNVRSLISDLGGIASAAALLGVRRPSISEWITRNSIPAERCPAVEHAFAGRVLCEQLRADVRWYRVPHPDWPIGKPLIDVFPDAIGAPPCLATTANTKSA